MKKKFFDKSLMIEGLTQLRLPGFIFLAISVLGSAIPAIFTCINYYSHCRQEGMQTSYEQSLRIIDIQRVAPILLPVIYIAPFVLCLVLFTFLNNRKGSDYYHSLSFTRVNLFLSFSAAIILWLALMVVSTVFVAYIIYAVAGMIINAAFIPYLIFTFLSAAMLVTACMLLAMSITGTAMTNTVLFGLILFLPRFILAIFMSNLFGCLPIISTSSGGLANVSNNIPVNLIYSYLISHSYSIVTLYTSIPAIVYTIVIAAIYFAAACLLFHFRKSEAAGSSAPNKVLQHVYRCAVTLPVAIFIPYIILDGIATRQLSSASSTIVTLAVISVFIYFLFELLTTKSFKKMIKSAPVFLAVVAVCVIYVTVISAARSSMLNFTPSGSEIESISILPTNSGNNGRPRTYNELKLKNVRFSDSLIKNDVSYILANDVSLLKSSGYFNAANDSSYHVGIRLKNGRYAERVLFAYDNMATEFPETLNTNSQYTENTTMLPDKSSISLMSVGDVTDKSSVRELWDSYKKEYNALPDSDKQSMAVSIYDSEKYLTSITADGSIDMEKYENSYKINEKTPKTAALYIKLLNLQNKAKAKAFISSFSKINSNGFYCDIEMYSGFDISKHTTLASIIEGSANDSKNVSKCFKILLKQIDGDTDITKPFVFVSISSGNKSFSYYQPVSSDSIKEIKKH